MLRAVYFVDAARGWIGGEGGYLSHTRNGGQSWTLQPAPTTKTISDVYFRTRDEGYLLANGEVLSTADEGQTWRSTLRLSAADFDGIEPQLFKIRFVNKKKGLILGAIETPGHAGDFGFLLITDDGGLSWSRQTVLSGDVGMDFDFVGEERGWIVSLKGKILRTVDGGKAWRTLPSGSSTGRSLAHLDFRDADNGIVVGAWGTILLTSDGGTNWRTISSRMESDLRKVSWASASEAWIVGDSGIVLRTDDGGQSWVSQGGPTSQNMYGLFIDKADCWVVGGNGLVMKYPR